MSRALIILNGEVDRRWAASHLARAPIGTRVEFKEAKRSLDQNAKLWAMLTEVSAQVVWHGQRLKTEDWKDIFTAALRQARVVPGIEPGSLVALGLHTSDMTKDEMSNLLELIMAFGAEHGVVFSDDAPPADLHDDHRSQSA